LTPHVEKYLRYSNTWAKLQPVAGQRNVHQ